MCKILIVDDDRDICLLLNKFLSRHGYEVNAVHSGKSALDYLQEHRTDLVISDFKLEDTDGSKLLVKLRALCPDVPVLIITGYSDIKAAVDVIKLGASDYITKPLYPDELLATIQRTLAQKTPSTIKPIAQADNDYVTGNSEEYRQIVQQIALVAPTNYSVIIYGESGSGKEKIAQQIHQQSKRKDMSFVAIDCGVLSKELAGSELFGHEKGAFTGAVGQKIGCLELANGGTIFLDEICNLQYDIQVSLLRVIQERKIRRIGGTKDVLLDVRIIVASNERLWDATLAGRFRADLFHRFNEFSIEVPSLKERKCDIMLFAHHFLKITNEELQKQIVGFSYQAEEVLVNYVWHGNLRELKNVVKRATLLTQHNVIDVDALPNELYQYAPPTSPSDHILSDVVAAYDFGRQLKSSQTNASFDVIVAALQQTDFNKSKAAKLLNIDRKTLYNKMKQFKQIRALQA
jgi:two-component system response regulator HydG